MKRLAKLILDLASLFLFGTKREIKSIYSFLRKCETKTRFINDIYCVRHAIRVYHFSSATLRDVLQDIRLRLFAVTLTLHRMLEPTGEAFCKWFDQEIRRYSTIGQESARRIWNKYTNVTA